jgi:anthranilate 1,2-dioxygenase small subunit
MMLEEKTRHAIEQLLYEWARTVDEDRLEDLAALLTEDARYKVISRFNTDRNLPAAVIDCRSRGQLLDRIKSLRVANIYEKHFYRHLLSGVQVIGGEGPPGGEVWEVRANYVLVRTMEHDGSISVYSSGQHQDSVVFEDSVPRFRSRVVVYDSRIIDTVLVIPI